MPTVTDTNKIEYGLSQDQNGRNRRIRNLQLRNTCFSGRYSVSDC